MGLDDCIIAVVNWNFDLVQVFWSYLFANGKIDGKYGCWIVELVSVRELLLCG